MEIHCDLEDRAEKFAQDCREMARGLIAHRLYESDLKQLIRSSGSVGANYLKGNDALDDSDRLTKFRSGRRECIESRHWLRILKFDGYEGAAMVEEKKRLTKEAAELIKLFSAIINKFDN